MRPAGTGLGETVAYPLQALADFGSEISYICAIDQPQHGRGIHKGNRDRAVALFSYHHIAW